MSKSSIRTVCCNITGVPLAVIHLSHSALAAGPTQLWQSQWNAMVTQHPYFGMSANSVLRLARIKLRELSSIDPTEWDDEAGIAINARVAFTAVLRNMGVVMRNEGSNNLPYILPSAATALAHAQHLLGLAYWYANNKSPKFKFPSINIAKINKNTELGDIGSYLAICQQQKDLWIKEEETDELIRSLSRSLKEDDEYLIVANRVERAVASSHSRKVSREQLWNWLQACIVADGAASAEKWKVSGDAAYYHELFFAPKAQWKRYTADDIESLEEVLLRFAPLGSAPFHAFRTKLREMVADIEKGTKAFKVDWASFTVGAAGSTNINVTNSVGDLKPTELTAEQEALLAAEEPSLVTYPNRVDLIRAQARWRLARAKKEELDRIALRKSII